MVGFHNPLSSLLHPHGHSSSRHSAKSKNQRKGDDERDAEGDGDASHEDLPVSSRVSSSCEIFNMFKFMASGKGNQQSLAEEVDSDEDEGEDFSAGSEPGASTSTKQVDEQARHLDQERPRPGSSATIQMGGSLHDDDEDDEVNTTVGDDEHKRDGLRDWHQAYGQDTSEMDAQGSRLAGKSPLLA